MSTTKSFGSLRFRWAVLACFLAAGNLLFAADPPGSKPEKTSANASHTASAVEPAKKARPIPFHGTLASFSASSKTITVGKRTFQIVPDTKLYKGDKKTVGSMSDARVGAPVTGSYFKTPEGKLMANSVYFKPALEKESSGTPSAPGPTKPSSKK